MNKVATSPLKLILFGEHSVLIGGRCLALCINKYCTLYLPTLYKKDEAFNILISDINNSKFILSLGSQIEKIDVSKKDVENRNVSIIEDENRNVSIIEDDRGLINNHKQISEQVDKQISEQVDKQISEKVDKQISEKVDNRISEKVDNRISEQVDKQISEHFDHQGVINIGYHLGCGLGSSAAVSILSSVALHEKRNINFYDPKSFKEEILKKADMIESIFHGRSSGVDCATLRHGGLISFKNKKVKKMNTEYLCKYKILIFNSRIQKDTAKIVKMKMNNKENNYQKLREISEEAYKIINKPFTLSEFYLLVRRAQDTFEDLGIVPEHMKEEVRKLRKLNIESKITGAGNGGHLFTLVEKDCEIKNWEEVKIDYDGFKMY